MPAPKGNKFALGNSGRSKKFKKPQDLQDRIDDYFNYCDLSPIRVCIGQSYGAPVYADQPRPYTIEGLAEYLDTNRQTLLNYQLEDGYEEFFDIITRAKQRIERQRIEMATIGVFKEGFTKFLLINNTDYAEKVEHKTTATNTNMNVDLTKEEIQQINDALEGEY